MEMIEYTGTDFWKKPTSYKPGPQIDMQEIAEVEQALELKLPESYKSLMMIQNGGELNFPIIELNDGNEVLIPYFHEIESESGVGLSPVFSKELGLPANLVFLTGDLHTWLALDYRKKNSLPSVLYLVEAEPHSNEWKEQTVAASFDDLLAKLRKYDPAMGE